MNECINQTKIKCVFLTKDNYEDFLKEVISNYENREYIQIKITEDSVIAYLDVLGKSQSYLLNFWYVNEEYNKWIRYSDTEFRNKYKIIN